MHHHQHLAAQVSQFLNSALSASHSQTERFLSQQVRCWGFPEFDPSTPDEYQGFFNYLIDVFDQRQWSIEQLLASDAQVLVRFRMSGFHHEEFMGLPATGAFLEFSANLLFRVRDDLIEESWMYKKSLRMTSKKGSVFELLPAPAQVAYPATAKMYTACS
ncbi:ester cyclase [Cellvibrio sp. UBA7661]|uniref:ester cyclase n=1 Tax=Cellvibrio sp. UBA7661 TaxID=1946311 RepID=UPI002F36003E